MKTDFNFWWLTTHLGILFLAFTFRVFGDSIENYFYRRKLRKYQERHKQC